MNTGEFQQAIKAQFPELTVTADPLDEQALIVPSSALAELLAWLKENPACAMHYLDFMTAADYPPERLRLAYSLFSFTHNHRLIIKTDINRDNAEIASVTQLWQNADWNEREVYDLYGVTFTGHPDLRRLLMPEDWEGWPLRKDFTHPNYIRRPD